MTLFRMLDLSSGQILIDGLDISQLPRHDIRSRINSITQDGVFIQGSVRDNIDPRGIHNLDAICDEYLAHRHRRLEEIRTALEHLGPDASISAVTDLVYSGIDPAVRFAAEYSVAAQLAYLRAGGDAAR